MSLLVIAVEETAALRSAWHNLSIFLETVIKSFCASEKAKVGDSQKSDDVALSLVVFSAHGANRPYLVYQTDWANDPKYFFKWLSSIDFNSDEYYDTVAVAKGLTQVLLACDHPPVPVEGLEKHCILVGSSSPEDQLPTAESVAENFLHSSISISVICPTPRPKLEAIYNAARRNKSANYHSISLENIESGYTFLIADNLIEACPYLSSHSDLLAIIPTKKEDSLTDTLDWARDIPAYDGEGVLTNTSPEWNQSVAPSDDPFCLYPQLGGPPSYLDSEHLGPLGDPSCLSPVFEGPPPSLDNEPFSDWYPDVSFDHGLVTSEIVPSAVRGDESEQSQSCTVPHSANGDLAKLLDINLSTRHPCLAPNHRPSWLIDSNTIAIMIRRAFNPEHVNWESNPSKVCRNCRHIVDNSDSNQVWPGLPRGVKFDPLDPEIIEHLLAKNGVNGFPPHPFIDDFIPTIKEVDGIYHTHPQKLPGVRPDGTVCHFFHKVTKATSARTKKRRKAQSDDPGDFRWGKSGKTQPVDLDGIPRGSKKVMVLYTSSVQDVRSSANWVMHLYHLGVEEEEKEGEYLISKVFYQKRTRSKQDGKDEATDLKNVGQGGENDDVAEKNHDSAELQGTHHTQGDL